MKIKEYNDFILYVGKSIEYCQTIEHDIKWLFALIKGGNPLENFKEISTWTLGNTVYELETLDISKIIPKKDYSVLKNITAERNYICHQIFRDFLYEEDFINTTAYQNACKRLFDFYNKLSKLHQQIEKFRLSYGSQFKY